MKLLIAFLYILVLVSGFKNANAKSNFIKEHQVINIHPADSKESPKKYTLIQTGNGESEPIKYHMWVDSVICRDKKCDIVKVRLNWDALGRYTSYLVKKGDKLTKLNHEKFSPDDLKRLHLILLDKSSALSEVNHEAITAKKKTFKKVDGISSATVMSLRNDVILGAAYTCFDLWHLANGSVINFMKTNSQKVLGYKSIQIYLNSADEEENLFATKCLIQKELFNLDDHKVVIHNIQKGFTSLVYPTMVYHTIKKGKSEDQLLSLYIELNERQRLIYLQKINTLDLKLNQNFYKRLCKYFSKVESFHETQLLLKLLKNSGIDEKLIVNQAVKLLSHQKFFIKRRAYQYLILNKRDKQTEVIIKEFYNKNKNRL